MRISRADVAAESGIAPRYQPAARKSRADQIDNIGPLVGVVVVVVRAVRAGPMNSPVVVRRTMVMRHAVVTAAIMVVPVVVMARCRAMP